MPEPGTFNAIPCPDPDHNECIVIPFKSDGSQEADDYVEMSAELVNSDLPGLRLVEKDDKRYLVIGTHDKVVYLLGKPVPTNAHKGEPTALIPGERVA